MSAGEESTNAGIISINYSTPFPLNREIENISIYANIFSVNANRWPRNLWFRGGSLLASKCSFTHNRWNAGFPTVGEYSNDDIAVMPDTLEWGNIESPMFLKKVQSLNHVQKDFFGRKRGVPYSNVGAFEFSVSKIEDDYHAYEISLGMRFYQKEIVEIPEQWGNGNIVCIDMRGRVFELSQNMNGTIQLPFAGYFLLLPKTTTSIILKSGE
jgi:hypothetical protein